jgi:outer membrane lipoprotein-sorting protein
MKSTILIGIMLASILLALSFGVALAAKENTTMSVNDSMSANITPDSMPLSVIVIHQGNKTIFENITISDNTTVSNNKTMTMLDNKSISDNMTMPISMPIPMPIKMPMNMSMPMNMPMSMPMKTTDAPMNIVVLQNVTVNIITIMPPNMINA